MIPFGIKLALAGLWPLVWHWGTPVAIIILCLAAELAIGWFSASVPFVATFLKPLQKDLLWVAAAAGLFLYGFSDGVSVEHTRSIAQQHALTKQVDKVVDQVLKDPANQPQPEVKGKARIAPRDKWDSPEN
jgi:hypothetical protein